MLGLAGAGDDRVWDEVRAWLDRLLKRPGRGPSLPPEAAVAVAYLARHPGGSRVERLVTTLRGRWAGVTADERSWFVRFWPAAVPDGPPAGEVLPPEPEALLTWVRKPLFGPAVFPPGPTDG